VHEASATSMPFADGTFDLIVSNLGVNNFDDREAAMKECRRVAKSTASIALTSNLQGHMSEFYEVFESVLRELNAVAESERLRHHIAHRATIDSIRRDLESAGFAINRVVHRLGRMRFASGTAVLRHHFVKLGFLDAWRRVVPDQQAEVFSRIEKRLNELADQNGDITLTIPMAYVEAHAV
jgi:SAM-dependent methyltransferase